MAYSNTITPASTWDTVPTPSDADDMDGTNEATVQQALANRDEFLRDKLCPNKVQQALIAHAENDVAEWIYDDTGFALGYASATVNAAEYLRIELANLVHGATITAWEVFITGPAGYGGVPAVENSARLYYMDRGDGSSSTIGGLGTDPATVAADYSLYRILTVTGLGHTIDLTAYSYFLYVQHESGANSQVGVKVFGAAITMTEPS